MKRNDFLDLLNKPQPILADGAMGTLLHERGVGFEQCFDLLNLTNPTLVTKIHRDYIVAGAQIILTNTFGANRFKLARHGLENKLVEINTTGIKLAKKVVSASLKTIWIGADVGPLGVRLAPFGRVEPEEARAAYYEQINALIKAGADLLVIETQTDLYEIREAITAARAISAEIPIIASMTFTRDDRTLLGDNPGKVAKALNDYGADIIGINCSGGPNQLIRILKEMREVLPQGRYWVKPNAGWPEQVSGRVFYPASPEYFGDYAISFWQSGARIIGGCCGTTPAHIEAMRKAIQTRGNEISVQSISLPTGEADELRGKAEEPTKFAKKLSEGKFVFAVEMDPPRGLSAHKILAGASLLAESGADVIDVADSPMARMRMSAWAVCEVIQQHVGVETTLHFPTRGRNLLRVQGDLLAAHALGIRNVFVVMGDPTSIGDYPEAADNYDIVPSGLIKLIKMGFNTGVDHSGISIGQPTSFFVGAARNLKPAEPDREICNAHRKVLAGADFFMTQPIYDLIQAQAFLKRYESEYGKLQQPVLVGILPLFNARHAHFLNHEVPGINIPEVMHQRLEMAGEDGLKEGIHIMVELAQQIKSWGQGIYLMPQFNRYDVVAEIVEAVK